MDKIEPQVVAVARADATSIVVLGVNRRQLAARGPGDLVTAEILFVIPSDSSDE